MWAALIEAAKAALFEKVKEMTKEEAKKLLPKRKPASTFHFFLRIRGFLISRRL